MLMGIGQVEAIFRYPVKSVAGENSTSPIWAGTASRVTGAWHSGDSGP